MRALSCVVFAAVFLAPLPASAAILIQIDKSSQRMTVSRDGQHLHTWPVSTGKRGHSTPSGSFKAFRMEKDHFSKEWDDAPMPNSIFFTKTGHAIHGSYDVKRIGSPASHGCVRLAPENAATLFNLVKADGVLTTQVVLTGTEPAPSQNIARNPRNPNAAVPQEQNPNVARLPGEDQNLMPRGAPNNNLDNQAYGQTYDDRYPPRYQQRAPADDQRYAQDGTYQQQQVQPYPPQNRQPPQYYGNSYYYQQRPQPYYGSRYPDPYYANPPQPSYGRGYRY
jgi:hypothetical protein